MTRDICVKFEPVGSDFRKANKNETVSIFCIMVLEASPSQFLSKWHVQDGS